MIEYRVICEEGFMVMQGAALERAKDAAAQLSKGGCHFGKRHHPHYVEARGVSEWRRVRT